MRSCLSAKPLLMFALAISGAPRLASGAETFCLRNALVALNEKIGGTFKGNPIQVLIPDGSSPLDLPELVSPQLHLGIMGWMYEHGTVLPGKNQSLNEVLRELADAGGEVRALKPHLSDLKAHFIENRLSYFRVSRDGVPILAIEPFSSEATISHELQHFRDWKAIREKLISQGEERATAGIKANKILLSSPSSVRWTEANAVERELLHIKLSVLDSALTKRIVYPEISSISKTLLKKDAKRYPNSNAKRQMIELMDDAIYKAIRIRELRIGALQSPELAKKLGNLSVSKVQALIEQARDLNSLEQEIGISNNSVVGLHTLYQNRFEQALRQLGIFDRRLPQ